MQVNSMQAFLNVYSHSRHPWYRFIILFDMYITVTDATRTGGITEYACWSTNGA